MKKILLFVLIVLMFVPSPSTRSQDKKCPTKEQIDAKLDSIVKQNTFLVKKVNDTIKVRNAKLKKKL